MLVGLLKALLNGSRVAPAGTAPLMLSATVDATGLVLTIVFDQAVTGGAGDGFFLRDPQNTALITVYVSGDGTDTLVVSVERAIYDSEPVTLEYVPGSVAGVVGGVPLATFSGGAVTNNSTVERLTTFDGGVSTTFNQTGLAEVNYKCWGAGGTANTEYGGGGGEYAESTSTFQGVATVVSAAGICTITVDSIIIAQANQGTDAEAVTPGVGGAGGIGDILNHGGDGGSVVGGGGGSGGDTTPGGLGGDGDGVFAGVGGEAGSENGAAGGDGALTGNGQDGNAPGGGGGASGDSAPGDGAPSRIEIRWTYT